MQKLIVAVLIFIFSFSELMARQGTANLDQIDFYDGNVLRFVGATSNYTYPSGQLAKMVVKINIEKAKIIHNFLDSAEVRLELLQITPDGDTRNDGFSQMHCTETTIINLLDNWVKSKGLTGYDKMHMKVALPKSELRMNPDRPSWDCREYKTAEVIFNK